MTNIKIGDLVWLKSGGPKMTVRRIDDNNKCACTWFDEKKQCEGTFYLEQLTDQDPNAVTPISMG